MAKTYEIQNLSIDEVIDEGLKDQIRKSIVINRIQTVCIAFFGISFAVVALLSLILKTRDIKFIETGAGKICGFILALSIIAYIMVPEKCPYCEQKLLRDKE